MFIENQSAETLTYHSETNVESYPPTIAPSTTSDEIRADGANKGSVGVISYAAGDTCLVTLEFSWIFNRQRPLR